MPRQDIRAPDLATLDLYCARVAGAVGHLSVHVFGDPSAAAHRVADALGRALQLTNILRDLDEDARRGRLYLPREILDRHGIRGADPVDGAAPSGAAGGLPRSRRDRRAVISPTAEQAMARCSRRAMRPAAVMGAVLSRDARRAAARGGATRRAGQPVEGRRSCGWCCATG